MNHVPILGCFFALGLFAASLWFAPFVLRRTALVMLVVVGIAGAAAKFSGEPAEDGVRSMPGVTRAAIHSHEEWADNAFLAAALLGVLSVGALVLWRDTRMPNTAAVSLFGAAVVVTGLMAYTGLLGGQVRHTEVRPGATQADAVLIEPRRVRPPAPADSR